MNKYSFFFVHCCLQQLSFNFSFCTLFCGRDKLDWGDWPSNGQTEIDAMIDAYKQEKQEDLSMTNRSTNGLEVSKDIS